MRPPFRLCLLAALAALPGALPWALPAAPAMAQEAPSGGEQVRLTPGLVDAFLASRPELKTLAGEFAKAYGDRAEDAGEDPIATLPAYADVPAAQTRLAATLHRYGFAGLAQWTRVSESVLTAAAYLDPQTPPPDVEGDKRKAEAEIDADAGLSAEQRQAAHDQLDAQFAPLFDAAPLPGNVAVVRPFAARLKALTGAE